MALILEQDNMVLVQCIMNRLEFFFRKILKIDTINLGAKINFAPSCGSERLDLRRHGRRGEMYPHTDLTYEYDPYLQAAPHGVFSLSECKLKLA